MFPAIILGLIFYGLIAAGVLIAMDGWLSRSKAIKTQAERTTVDVFVFFFWPVVLLGLLLCGVWNLGLVFCRGSRLMMKSMKEKK